jgi:hypothetical protein
MVGTIPQSMRSSTSLGLHRVCALVGIHPFSFGKRSSRSAAIDFGSGCVIRSCESPDRPSLGHVTACVHNPDSFASSTRFHQVLNRIRAFEARIHYIVGCSGFIGRQSLREKEG